MTPANARGRSVQPQSFSSNDHPAGALYGLALRLLLGQRRVLDPDLAFVGAKDESDAVLVVLVDVLGLERVRLFLPLLREGVLFLEPDRVPVGFVDVGHRDDRARRLAL